MLLENVIGAHFGCQSIIAPLLHTSLIRAYYPGALSAARQGYEIHPGPGYKILSVTSAREGSSMLTDGQSIPGPRPGKHTARSWTEGTMERLTGISLHLSAQFLWQPQGTYDMSCIPQMPLL